MKWVRMSQVREIGRDKGSYCSLQVLLFQKSTKGFSTEYAEFCEISF